MWLVSSSVFADHLTPPGHPESPERAEVLEGAALRAESRGGTLVEPRAATRDELRRVHTDGLIDAIEATRGKAVMIDPDTFTSPKTADVAALAAGAAIVAVEHALGRAATRGAPRAAALVRPPGHHAESDRAMGFCLFNNVAVAAAHARHLGLNRVAVVDYDVHHGNGTQEMFEHDPSVLFISAHQYPFYPGTGAAIETGRGDGVGCTVNLPVEAGGTDGDYLRVFDAGVVPVLEHYRPELILVSAGFDAHEQDPLAQMRVTTEGFRRLTWKLREVADRVCEGRLVLVTEGGYALPALGASLDAALAMLADDAVAPPADADLRPPTGRAERTLQAVRAAQAGRWHGL